ncbi:sugar transferase [Flavobacterium sp.]|uniref:sugar transferase n=1 Tax=Flavobacterium sp. TaxID=239 RepID=UPI0037BF72E8
MIQTIEALKLNPLASKSVLIIFSDAPKNEKEQEAVLKVRAYLKTISGFKTIVVNESENNKGLANSIINGVNKVFEQYDTVIVLEDDLICTSNFLSFMNQSLQNYSGNNLVFSVSGYSFNLNSDSSYKYDTYFLNRGWSWGWATWRSKWVDIDWEIKDYNSFIKNRNERQQFSKGGSDLVAMLQKQMNGKLDSWAIRWFYNQYKTKGLTVYPVLSKVFNNGFDNRATNTNGSSKRYIPVLDKTASDRFIFPEIVGISMGFQRKFLCKMSILSRIKSKFESFFGI